ncbi:hypothetical protein PR202_gb26398 [Eleusine coracana subsp. coracana]|uniref:Uncharacterized protein n=1 Tax=Eleusine coracana subsp. coracana TaxID=191504 RepID=A0AAV5FR37_ELECO|nr:hypothetical protein PR202_gb26398 [Eleusine coracana subsp. coracana]
MTTAVQFVEPEPKSGGAKAAPAPAVKEEGRSSSSGYVRDMMTYTVMDGLSVVPIFTICAVTTIVALGVTDISGLQAMTVEIGHKEGLALLKASMQSQTVLSQTSSSAQNRALLLEMLVSSGMDMEILKNILCWKEYLY